MGDGVALVNFITEIDFSILDFIYENIRCDFLDPIMAGITHFADGGIGWIILGLILLIPKNTRMWGATGLIAMLLGFVCGEFILKNLFCRVRPYDAYELFHSAPLPFVLNAGSESSYSFPSGHTCCSFAFATAYFLQDKKWGTVALIFAGMVGFSRLYNYVHFPTDVLGGALLGVVSAFATLWIFKKFAVQDKLLKTEPNKENI